MKSSKYDLADLFSLYLPLIPIPMFAEFSGNNYHLSPGSPCVDAGTDYYEINTGFENIVVVDIPESDFSGSAPDMGANELMQPPLGDINQDFMVDVMDIIILVNLIE